MSTLNMLRLGCRAALHPRARTYRISQVRSSSVSIEALRDRFKDPTSPFHLPSGTQGPGSPDTPVEELSAAEEGRAILLEHGFDPESFWEQKVVWGDHDSFQHVNNVNYVRFFETGRIQWMRALGKELGGPAKADAMTQGKGVSLILKSISVNYKYPVVYPDTLLVAHVPYLGHNATSRQAKTHFGMKGAIWSYAQRRMVTESDTVVVWYDYDRLAKCDPGEEVRAALQRRMTLRAGGKDVEKD